MKKLLLLLSLLFLLSADFAFALDKQIICPKGACVIKGNTTAKIQTYNTGAWQDRLTILNDGKVGIGPSTSSVIHTIYGGTNSIYKQYTGGVTRSLSTTPTPSYQQIVIRDDYTNLSTTPWNVNNGVNLFSGSYNVFIRTADNDTCTFILTMGIDDQVTLNFTAGNAANCAVAESPEGTFAITGIGDGTTYTLAFSNLTGAATFKASGTRTGTTILILAGGNPIY